MHNYLKKYFLFILIALSFQNCFSQQKHPQPPVITPITHPPKIGPFGPTYKEKNRDRNRDSGKDNKVSIKTKQAREIRTREELKEKR